jgi:hypothetical protein
LRIVTYVLPFESVTTTVEFAADGWNASSNTIEPVPDVADVRTLVVRAEDAAGFTL